MAFCNKNLHSENSNSVKTGIFYIRILYKLLLLLGCGEPNTRRASEQKQERERLKITKQRIIEY
jgi:hypothetical protein